MTFKSLMTYKIRIKIREFLKIIIKLFSTWDFEMKRSSSYLPRVYSAPPVCFLDNSRCWCGLYNCRGGSNSNNRSMLNSNNRPRLNSNSDPGPGGGEVVSTAVIHHHNIGPVVTVVMVTIMVTDHAHTPLKTLVTPVTRVQYRRHVSHLMGHVHMMLLWPLPDHNNSSPDPSPVTMAAPVCSVTVMVTWPEAGDWEDDAIQDNADPDTRHRDNHDDTN